MAKLPSKYQFTVQGEKPKAKAAAKKKPAKKDEAVDS
jgi:hypothetical protein|tara:strand:- start:2083 stop:2193 length:111 start_codon:yes stop_codon:yes gene_type:complete